MMVEDKNDHLRAEGPMASTEPRLRPLEILETTVHNWKGILQALNHPRLVHFLLRTVGHKLMFERETERNKKKRYGFMSIGGGMIPREELVAYRHGLEVSIQSLEEVIDAARQGKPVISHFINNNSELVRAMGVPAFYLSAFTKIANYLGTDCSAFLISEAERYQAPEDLCGLNKMALGAYLTGQIPAIFALMSSEEPCDSVRSFNQMFEYLTEKPAYNVNTPYDRTPEAIARYVGSAFELIAFLEEKLGRKMDWDRLKQYGDEINKFNACCNEISLMHRSVPSPNLFLSMGFAFAVRQLAPGSPGATKLVEALYEIGKQRISVADPARKKNERIRVIMWDLPVAFAEMTKWMEKQYGAVIVADYLTSTMNPPFDTSTRESLVRGLYADKLYTGMVRQSHGTAALIGDELTRYLEEYSAHCVIVSGHMACKHNKAANRIVQDICRHHDIPLLMLELDVWDSRHNPEREIKKQLGQFLERIHLG